MVSEKVSEKVSEMSGMSGKVSEMSDQGSGTPTPLPLCVHDGASAEMSICHHHSARRSSWSTGTAMALLSMVCATVSGRFSSITRPLWVRLAA